MNRNEELTRLLVSRLHREHEREIFRSDCCALREVDNNTRIQMERHNVVLFILAFSSMWGNEKIALEGTTLEQTDEGSNDPVLFSLFC